MDEIIVGIAEGRVAKENQVLISYALGSRVGICPYDRRERITGMAHIILLERKYSIHWDGAYRFADEGVHELINQMREQRARPAGLIAKIAGSTRTSGAPSGMLDMGQQNVVTIGECLAQEGIHLIAQHTGQSCGRIILLHTENGKLEMNTVRHLAVVLQDRGGK